MELQACHSSMYKTKTTLKGVLVCFALLFWRSCDGFVFDIPENQKFPALLVFGDSIVDPGNNNDLITNSRADYLPYGQDFDGGVPTGRFSNGKVPSDIIAQELSIKESVPAYLDPNLQPTDLTTGVSFASGGCGYDPLSSVLAIARPLSEQLDQFKQYKSKLQNLVGEDQTNHILSRSLVLIVAGSNDIANTYFGPLDVRKLHYDINSYTDFLSNAANDLITALYGLGVRRIAIFSAPPLGCLPSQRTVAGGIERKCVESYNQASILFNSKLSSVANSFNHRNKDAKAVIFDIYSPVMDLIKNPAKNGFQVVDKGCCGSGKVEVTFLCTQLNPLQTCSDPTKYIFWDSFHPTQTAYELLCRRVLLQALPKLYI